MPDTKATNTAKIQSIDDVDSVIELLHSQEFAESIDQIRGGLGSNRNHGSAWSNRTQSTNWLSSKNFWNFWKLFYFMMILKTFLEFSKAFLETKKNL